MFSYKYRYVQNGFLPDCQEGLCFFFRICCEWVMCLERPTVGQRLPLYNVKVPNRISCLEHFADFFGDFSFDPK